MTMLFLVCTVTLITVTLYGPRVHCRTINVNWTINGVQPYRLGFKVGYINLITKFNKIRLMLRIVWLDTLNI